MAGIGMLMLALILTGNILRIGGRLYTSRLFLRACEFAAPLGFVAVIAGWTTTEVGRQPWTVYGLLRTAQSVSPSLTGSDVSLSLAGYMAAYLVMFPAGVLLMARIIGEGADGDDPTPEAPIGAGRPNTPFHTIATSNPNGRHP
jgi:cytochrome bd ubiquinol oxidase subunit I